MRQRAILVLAAVVSWGAACDATPPETPEVAFAEAIGHIRAGEYDRVWLRLTEKMQDSWSAGILEQKRAAADPGDLRQTVEDLLGAQYGLSVAEFVGSTPRELYAAYLRRNREQVLRYRVVRPAKVRGDRASLYVDVESGEDPAEWVYALVDGRWLLDDVPGQRRK